MLSVLCALCSYMKIRKKKNRNRCNGEKEDSEQIGKHILSIANNLIVCSVWSISHHIVLIARWREMNFEFFIYFYCIDDGRECRKKWENEIFIVQQKVNHLLLSSPSSSPESERNEVNHKIYDFLFIWFPMLLSLDAYIGSCVMCKSICSCANFCIFRWNVNTYKNARSSN